MANALTAYTGDGTQLFSGQLVKFEFNTDTAGTADPVVITGDMISNCVFTMNDIANENAKAVSGFPHATDIHLEFDLQTVGESGGLTFLNEIRATGGDKIAWVRITFLGAQTITVDSGTNNDPIMFFKTESQFGDKERAASFKVIGDGTIAATSITIS